jgi:signal peptidase I
VPIRSLHKLQSLKKWFIWPLAIVATFFAAIYSSAHLYPAAIVHGASMTPNLVPQERIMGERYFDEPQRHEIFIIDQNQVTHKGVKHLNGPYVKRLVGIPGDTLVFNVEDGELLSINGEKLKKIPAPENKAFELESTLESSKGAKFIGYANHLSVNGLSYTVYQADLNTLSGKRKELFRQQAFNYPFLDENLVNNKLSKFVIPDGMYFALSDNRPVGIDSRHFGLVPASALKYKLNSET